MTAESLILFQGNAIPFLITKSNKGEKFSYENHVFTFIDYSCVQKFVI